MQPTTNKNDFFIIVSLLINFNLSYNLLKTCEAYMKNTKKPILSKKEEYV